MKYRLSDISLNITDGEHGTVKDNNAGNCYLLSCKNIKNGQIEIGDKERRIDSATKEKLNKRTKLSSGDILITTVGTIGEMAMIHDDAINYSFQRSVGVIKPDKSKVEPEYLYYSIMNESSQINTLTKGAVQKCLFINDLKKIEVEVPNINTQKKIVKILSALDSKIANNNIINNKLTDTSLALFKQWFIDFAPFRDESFKDSKQGRIPESWDASSLGKISSQQSARVGDRHGIKVLSPIVSGELVLSEDYFTKQVFSANTSKYKLVRPLEFAYNPARVNIGSLGRNDFDFVGCVSPVYVVFKINDGYEYFFDLFRRREVFKKSVESLAIGGVRQSLSYKDFASIDCVIPPVNIIRRFNELYTPLLRAQQQNKRENLKLLEIRNTLIPKLMSGEINLDKVEI